MDDQLIAMESLLNTAALRREDFLRNFFAINQRSVQRRAPYSFVLPPTQADPGAARKLLETLDFGSVEIEKAAEAFQVGVEILSGGQLRGEDAAAMVRLREGPAGAAEIS
ncbi:MAG: hypothetical protein QM757_07215 [Paludibaculum sp.]